MKRRRRKWGIRFGRLLRLGLGVHFDHSDPSLQFHLWGVWLDLGNLKKDEYDA